MSHDYPRKLAAAALAAWPHERGTNALDCDRIAAVLASCFLASLMREEARPINFRMILGPADDLPHDEGPPSGLQVLKLTHARDFNPDELRRLSPSAEFHRAMIGADVDESGTLKIWGMVYTGPRWVREFEDGRTPRQQIPDWPIVHVRGPGHLAVFCGPQLLATLRGGEIESQPMNLLYSEWLPSYFAGIREEIMQRHTAELDEMDGEWAEIDESVISYIGRHLLGRALSLMRRDEHGGTILVLPNRNLELLDNGVLRPKYRFEANAAQQRFQSVLRSAMREIARSMRGREGLSWEAYANRENRMIADLEEAVDEIGHLLAGLSAVDGALVMDLRFNVLGFGTEISGELPSAIAVQQACDPEARESVRVAADSFGTRHRSVFRLCAAYPDVLAIVVSQDRATRIVKNLDGKVTYFNQAGLGAV